MQKKVLIINSFCGCGSTGKIVESIAREWIDKGVECRIAYGRDKVGCEDLITYQIGNKLDYQLHGLKTRVFDMHGFGSVYATKKLIKWIEDYNPDLIHLHNIHGYYINIDLLFKYLKKANKKTLWTLHDCWSFTGHCTHFDFVGCDKWKYGCFNCPQKNEYPKSNLFENSKNNYKKKKSIFTGIKDLTIITPSKWLANLVKESFLKEYFVEVVYNMIDTEVFKPRQSDFREKNNLVNKKIVLGVANIWGRRKGLNDFYELSKTLTNDYKIILVGLDDNQMKKKPENILGIKRTYDAIELAEIYSAADVFLNLSVEETFGLTTAEALCCGTPTIIYKNTAGEEIIEKYDYGYSCEKDCLTLVCLIKSTLIRNEADS